VTIADETFSKVLHVALCPNRLEFPWPFQSTVDWGDWPYGEPGRNYTLRTEKFCVYVGKQEIMNFLCRGILHSGDDSWPYDALFPGLEEQVWDDWQVKGEPESYEDAFRNNRLDDMGHAEAPLFATFAAHFAEASERFNPYNCQTDPWSFHDEYMLRIPIRTGARYGLA